jgi:hypothetical protein
LIRQEVAIQVVKMFNAPVPARSGNHQRSLAATPFDDSERGQSARLLEGELMDLYVAIAIVVPAAIFLKSLWV